jgi:TonB family protein
MTPILSILVKATFVATLGLLAAWITRHNRASVRHALLTATLAVLLLLPAASILAPPIRIALPQTSLRIAPVAAGELQAVPSATPRPALSASAVSLSTLLLAAWMVGAILFLTPVATGIWQVRALRRSALPWSEGQSLVGDVEVLTHESLSGPMACGVFRPAIVFSADAATWSAQDLQRALVHELEHVRRFDWLTQCLARVVCALYWFHPLVWIVRDRLALEAERSCDDAVLRTSEPAAYADQLVELAQRLSAATRSPLLTMANRADLAVRVGAVLDSRLHRGRAGARSIMLACAGAGALLLAVSPLRVVEAQSTAPVQTGAIFNVNVPLVIEDVTVKDPGGTPIEGLNASDFVVTEDGVPQQVSFFESSIRPSYYVLGYRPNNPSGDVGFRKIKVELNNGRAAKLDFRSGYYTRAPRPAAAMSPVANGSIDRTVTPPVLISKREPDYSEEARKAKLQGTVVLSVEIDGSGAVTNASVVRSLGLGLDEKAVESVYQWRFRPGMRGGQPVSVQTSVQVNFRLL